MQKIPTIYVRDWDGNPNYVTDTREPLCDWVFAGAYTAHRKFDGTCVMLDRNGEWWARREVKPGKTPPPNWVPVETDDHTGKAMGWEPIGQSGWAKFHAEALDHGRGWDGLTTPTYEPGTYELCGPKIMRNPEGFERHLLINHRTETEILLPCDPGNMGDLLAVLDMLGAQGQEGIVFHHISDDRMAKIKVRDVANRLTGEQVAS